MRLRGEIIAAVVIAAAACQAGEPDLDTAPTETTTTAAPIETSTTSAAPTTTQAPRGPTDGTPAPNGRRYPGVATDPTEVARRLVDVEQLLRSSDPGDAAYGDLAHEQQVLYRHIARNPDWILPLWETVPDELFFAIERHVTARQAISSLSTAEPSGNVPAWEIIEPLPADELLTLYRDASAETGIDWAYLAAINLLETGFGRIDGLSIAGAQGPMQFLPSTWAEVSDGDIRNPYDAIPAAARYLVRRGGPEDMARALFGYNNSEAYVTSISAYADLFRTDQAAFYAAHQWEIHYSSSAGDLWLPVGYRLNEVTPAQEYLLAAPWSAPPTGSSP